MPRPAKRSFSARLLDKSIDPWSSFAEDIFLKYGLIFGVELFAEGIVARSGKGCSSYVAKGVVKVVPLVVNGLGGPGRDPDPPLLCSFG